MSVGGGEWNRDLLRQGLEILFALLWGSQRARPFSLSHCKDTTSKCPKSSLFACACRLRCVYVQKCVYAHIRVLFPSCFSCLFVIFYSALSLCHQILVLISCLKGKNVSQFLLLSCVIDNFALYNDLKSGC